jgi:hypothetical protein
VAGAVVVAAPGSNGTGAVGLAGDRVYDVRHHGGTDQAVYAYARESPDGWEAELGRPLPNGFFGENLTTAGIDVNGALIGERWRIGARNRPAGGSAPDRRLRGRRPHPAGAGSPARRRREPAECAMGALRS